MQESASLVEQVTAALVERSIETIENAINLLKDAQERGGGRVPQALADDFCRRCDLPRLTYGDFMKALESARNRKSLAIDPYHDDVTRINRFR